MPGVTCHLSQARTGGMKGTVGVAEDRSRFAIACRQIGPITVDLTTLPKKAEVFSVKTSLIFNGSSPQKSPRISNIIQYFN